ncbi:MAG TPA: MBL fold metallo-hydrolase [Thermoguttaceae bacterium]|nr:MBL fold metallo-hydrolase [Thermoguttaceae bacterium]
MLVIPLQSGSNGNCIYVEAGDRRLLFDAGISGRQAQERLETFGRSIKQVDAVFISHDHADHARCLGIYHRKFGLPIHVTRKTLSAARQRTNLGEVGPLHHFESGQTVRLDGVSVETIPTPHDGADGVAFVVDDGRRRVGILTDLGHVFKGLSDVLRSLDAVLIESNYDPDLLRDGSYPPSLQERIRGPGGHLSNAEAARLLAKADVRFRWVCLGHLSEENNHPKIALDTHHKILGRDRWPLHVASRYEATEPLEV